MRIRVTFVSAGSVPESLIALVPQPARIDREEAAYGRRVTVFAHHEEPRLLAEALRAVAGKVAVGVVTEPLAAAPARLLLMDVDSTLTTTEAVDLLAEHAGVGERVAEITERAMRGELDFAESLAERVGTLRGLPTEVFAEVGPRMTLSPGAMELIATAKAAGALVGVTSGGFVQLVQPLAERLGLDFYNANLLETEVVDGVEVAWWPGDPVLARDEAGAARGLALAAGDWADRHRIEAVLRATDPETLALEAGW